MRVVKGIYENGVVSLMEKVSLKDKQEITVLIPDTPETGNPEMSATVREVLRFAGMLSDLSPEEIASFDEALKQGVRFTKKVRP